MEQLLGGLGGGLLGGQQQRQLPRSQQSYRDDQQQTIFDSPIAKAALAGIAAIAVKRAMSGQGFGNKPGGLQGNRVRDDMI